MRFGRKIDVAVMVAVLLAAAFMIARPPVAAYADIFPFHAVGAPWYVAVSALVIWLLRNGRGVGQPRSAGLWDRAVAYGTTLLLCGVAVSRARLIQFDHTTDQHWPPRFSDNRAAGLDSIAPKERAEWAAAVALHRMVTAPNDPFSVPRSWPFPADARVAIRATESRGSQQRSVEVWSRTAGGIKACSAQPAFSQSASCDPSSVSPPADSFHVVRRIDDVLPVFDATPDVVDSAAMWTQYRRDAAHSAQSADSLTKTPHWTHLINGPIRASASVANGLVLIGAHFTGTLDAVDAESGQTAWSSRLPNWVHMGVVSDGHVAVVGFGDNRLSFVGRAPSGVSVYDLRTGRLNWTAFDESSVMTSPVLHDSVMVYSTALGVLRKRRLSDGKVLAIDTLPGGAVMAPPAMLGDTVVFGLEPDHTCAVLISTLKTIWCRHLPDLRWMGHAAPTIHDGMVMTSGLPGLQALTLEDFQRVPWSHRIRLLLDAVFTGKYKVDAGQRFFAFRMHDGQPVWRSPLFSDPHRVDGHIAGTATVHDSVGVIVLPVANRVVGFNPYTGRIRWQSEAHGARGPSLLVDGLSVVTGRDGVIEVRSAIDGTLRCSVTNAVGYDRAGPVLVGSLMVLAELKGRLEVVPAEEMLRCQHTSTPSMADPKNAPVSPQPHDH